MGRGWVTDGEDNVLVGNMEWAVASELHDLREGGACEGNLLRLRWARPMAGREEYMGWWRST